MSIELSEHKCHDDFRLYHSKFDANTLTGTKLKRPPCAFDREEWIALFGKPALRDEGISRGPVVRRPVECVAYYPNQMALVSINKVP